MKKFLLASVISIAFIANAAGYDFLYTNDYASTLPAGVFGGKLNVYYATISAEYDKDGEKQDWEDDYSATKMYVPVDIRYSAIEYFELRLQPKFVNNKYSNATEMTGSGIGDLWVAGKYLIVSEPKISARVGAKFALGTYKWTDLEEDELPTGDGQMDIDIGALVSYPMEPITFDFGVGYRLRMEGENEMEIMGETVSWEFQPGNEIHYMFALGYPLSEAMGLKIGIDGYMGSNAKAEDAEGNLEEVDETAMSEMCIAPGFWYKAAPIDFGVDVYVFKAMAENVLAPSFVVVLGIGYTME